jgi:hypothetical protein
MHRPRVVAHATANPTGMQTAGRVGFRHRAASCPAAQSARWEADGAYLRCSRRKGGELPPARHPAEAGALPHGRSTWPQPGCAPRRSPPDSRWWPCTCAAAAGATTPHAQHHLGAAREPPQALWTWRLKKSGACMSDCGESSSPARLRHPAAARELPPAHHPSPDGQRPGQGKRVTARSVHGTDPSPGPSPKRRGVTGSLRPWSARQPRWRGGAGVFAPHVARIERVRERGQREPGWSGI